MRIQAPKWVILSALFSSVLAHQAVSAQTPVQLPELNYKRLMNDLQVTVASTPALGESMTIGLVVRYGSIYDPADKGGLANLLSKMFTKATVDLSAKEIQEDLTALGATLEVSCDWDGFRFILHGQSSKFERSLLLLYQVVGEVQFNDADFAKTRSEILEEFNKPEDPRQRLHSIFEMSLFKGTSYGRSLRGSRASVQNLSIGDVRLFYRRHFLPNASALIIVGSAPAQLVLQKATRIWGVWVRRDEIPFNFLPPRTPSSRTFVLDDDPTSPAAQFILGNLWPRRDDPTYYAGMLAIRILQDRLTKILPTSLLTVAAEGRRMTGPFYIQGQAAADQTVSEIGKVIEAVESMKSAPVLPEELATAQKRWSEEFYNSLKTTDGICASFLDSELYRLGTNYQASFPDLLNRFDADAVKNAAKDWLFPGGVLICVRGPAAILRPMLEPLGPVQPITR